MTSGHEYLFVTKVFIIVLSAILCLMYLHCFHLCTVLTALWHYGVVASIRQIRERHKEEDPKNKNARSKEPTCVCVVVGRATVRTRLLDAGRRDRRE